MYIVIIGCGRIGSGLAGELSSEGHNVAIVDNVQENLDRLGTGFNGTRIKGVEIDKDVLVQAGIQNADIFLALTKDDNINIMASQIAKKAFGVKQVISRIYEPQKEFIYKKLGIETMNTTELLVNVIKNRLIIETWNTLAVLDKDLFVAEIPVYSLKYDNISEIQEKYNCIISAIIRDGNVILAPNVDILKEEDKLICTINKSDMEVLVDTIS